MPTLEVKNYRPPFVTQSDEAIWDDCTICSTLMATASWSLGYTVLGPDWRPMNAKELKVRRERIRDQLPADKQFGATSMADMRYAFGKFFPWLPQIPFWDVQRNTWDDFVEAVNTNSVAVIQGNPAKVRDTSSGFRRWTNNDKFDHAIHCDRGKKVDGVQKFFIMDPLGRGDYDGEWVTAEEMRQFLNREGNILKVTIFERGWASPAAIATRKTREKFEDDMANLERLLKICKDNAGALRTEVSTLKQQLQDCQQSEDCTELKTQLAETQAALATANTTVQEVTAKMAGLQSQAATVLTQATAAQAAAQTLVDSF